VINILRRLARSEAAASAAEFGMVVPLLVLLLLGIIDVGRFAWELNRSEKATQMGARLAAVTDPVSSGLIAANFASASVRPGELIPAEAMPDVICSNATCTCAESASGVACPVDGDSTVAETAFDNIVERMQAIKPDITEAQVRVTYSGSGFGFAGSPPTKGGGGAAETMEVSPLITVSIEGAQFTPITSLLLASINLPTASTTVVAEDLSGSYSN
jgi:hypothetical protein